MQNRTKRILKIISLLIVIFVLFMMLISYYLYGIAIRSDKDKTAFFKGLSAQEYDYAFMEDDFFSITKYDDIYINSFDHLKLHSYEFHATNHHNKWIIVVHGYMGEGKEMAATAHQFYDMGYNILIPDLRGHGASEGNYIGMGWNDRYDLVKWIDYLIKEDPNCEIILYGISMGASTVMNTCGEQIPDNVKMAIADCGFSSVWDILSYQMQETLNIPVFPLLYMSDMITQIKNGFSFKEADTRKQLANAKIPILFIHGDQDRFVPFYMLDELYESANCPKEKLVIKNAKHGVSSQIDPLTYWQHVKNFIHKYMS